MREEIAIDATRVGDDDHFPPVVRVDLTPDEATPFEAVDYSCDRTRRQAGELGEGSRRGRAVEQQKTERAQVCLVESDLLERLEVGDEELDDEVTELQLEIADGDFTRCELWLVWQSIFVC